MILNLILGFLDWVGAMCYNEKTNMGYIRALHPIGFIYIVIVYFLFFPFYCMFTEEKYQTQWQYFTQDVHWW